MLAIKCDTTLNDICKRYQVAPSLVHKWKSKVLEQGSQLFAKGDKSAEAAVAAHEQIQSQLYEKIGQLTIEHDFLKKSWSRFRGSKDEN